jgi:16S rRNA (cytidine1402-2'-O)-methyltransferase
MTGPGAGQPGTGPGADVDPDVLEELESWSGPDDDAHNGDSVEDGGREDGAGPGASEVPVEPGRAGAGPGSLVVVGTPIGNLGDLSPRAVTALGDAEVVYCEDTRHSRKLLTHAGITGATLRSLHEHNEDGRIDEVVASVRHGRTVALVTDAGMPGVSDPGSRVVRAVAAAGLTVTVVPGPSAVLTALVGSGLATDRFCFEGFLPRSGKERRSVLAAVAAEPRTTVLFEAPGRVAGTLVDLAASCGPARPVSVARELTKLHEEFWRGTLAEAVAWATGRPVRGEVVLVVGGAPLADAVTAGDDVLLAALDERLGAGERTRGAVDGVAAAFGVPRRRVYELALAARDRRSAGEASADPDPGGPGRGPPG